MNRKNNIAVQIALFLIGIFGTSMLVVSWVAIFLYDANLFDQRRPALLLLAVCTISMLIGIILTRIIGRKLFSKLQELSNATKEVARGNYLIHIESNTRATIVNETIDNFNTMVRQLASTEVLRNDFVENVSHEFKTPIAAIEGYVTLLQRKDISSEMKDEYVEKIIYNTKRLSSLTGNILLLSRIENQEVEIEKELFDLSEEVRSAIVSLESKWLKKGLDLDIDMEEVAYIGNKELLQHAIINVIDNSIKYNKHGGKLTIVVKQEEKIIIKIIDTGIGMSQEVLGRAYEKFYQGDTSRTSQGNGLGLSLVSRIIKLHGGTISLTSTDGEGTTCIMTL